jgi:hypothetical protein
LPLFSVIIPTYNRAAFLREALGSVTAQTFTDYEVIVVDDGSTDETAEVVADFGHKVQFLSQANQGPGAARNLGAQDARGEYLAFLDSDDLWFPWTLETYWQALSRPDRPSWVAGKGYKFEQVGQLHSIPKAEVVLVPYRDYLAAAPEALWIGTCAVGVRHTAFQEVGGFTAGHVNGEDSDLWLKLGCAPGFVNITSPTVFAYRQHGPSAVMDNARTYRGMLHLIQQERNSAYPGGNARTRDRLAILCRHVRPASVGMVKKQDFALAWSCYRSTFRWNLQLLRFKYLIGLPAVLVAGWLKAKLA